MRRVAWKSLLARKGRLVLTSLAVILGTAFLAGSFIFTDTIQRTFDNLFAQVYEDTDAFVRSSSAIDTGFGEEVRNTIPDSVVEQVAAVPGVSDAQGYVDGFARIIGSDGEPVGSEQGPPTFGGSMTTGELSTWTIADGRPPAGPDEVALNAGAAKDGDFEIGDTVKVTSNAGSREFTLTGIARFGDADSPGGATFALFDLPTAQEFVNERPGELDAVLVRGDGSLSDDELAAEIEAAVGLSGDIEVLTGAEITDETQSSVREGLSFFTIFLQAFAFIALFVSVFVIYNVFSITMAQRQRENALLRAVGASSRQVSITMLVEAVVIGLIGSLIGIGLGILLAQLLQSGLEAAGVDIPSSGIYLQPRTIVVTIVVGLLVTVVSALVPALRSGRVPPVAAMRDTALETTGAGRNRLIVGSLLLALGIACVLFGLFAGEPIFLAPGVPLVFIALFVLGPLVSAPVARWIGRPIAALRGVTGRMAEQNAVRNPKRTARTAAALMIGVALVTGVAVIAASVRDSVREIFGEQLRGDVVVTTNTFGFGGLSTDLAPTLQELPEVETATGIGINFATIEGDAQTITLVDPSTVGDVFDLEFAAGAVDDLTDDGILLSEGRAEDDDLVIGDTLALALLDGVPRTVTVQGIYGKDELAGPYTVSKGLFEGSSADVYDFAVFTTRADGVSEDELRTAVQTVVDEYGNGEVQTRSEYIDDQAAQIDPVLNLIIGLLLLSVFIALIGIIITLVLSIYERRREIGLVRAVGATRRQVRTTVRWEAVITSLLGAFQGIVVGLLLGYAVVLALRSEGLSTFTVPWTWILTVVVGAFVVGVVAAIIPAWRATKVDVLESLATT
ncbi:MAG TPA: FtsX-like permease family protein [Acidimicrobiales bacterium]|nr:FtsX-like permease family protein [Acidimicrobiales bacterium]